MPRNKTGHFYYSWYPTIYGADTMSLTLAEDGAYHRLIDHYMTSRAPLPNDDAALARIVGVGREEWEAVKDRVKTYFKPSINPAGYLHHSFCDDELKIHNVRITSARENGKKGGRPKKLKDKDNNPAGFKSETQQKAKQNRTEGSDTNVSAQPVDFKRVIFDEGLRWLSERTKRAEPTLRSLLGKWCRDYGEGAVAAALVKAQQSSPVEAISFIEKIIKEASNAKNINRPAVDTKTDRAKAAVARAASAGGYANARPGRETGAGDDNLPMFPNS